MEITLLKDIKRKLFIRSSMIALSSIDELLGMNDYISADEIFLEIIKSALREYEKTEPLFLEMKLSRSVLSDCQGMPGFAEIKSNFTHYLDGMIGEDQIILVPNSTPQWRAGSAGLGVSSFPTACAYTYFSEYRRPYLFIGDMPSSEFVLRGMCSRPVIPDFLPDRSFNPDSEKAGIYWMNIEEGNQGQFFLDICMCHLLDYIRQLKASVQLPGMNMEILGNVDSAYQELKSRTDQYVYQSGWTGKLIL